MHLSCPKQEPQPCADAAPGAAPATLSTAADSCEAGLTAFVDEANERMRRTRQSWEQARDVIREMRQMLQDRQASAEQLQAQTRSPPPRQDQEEGGPSPTSAGSDSSGTPPRRGSQPSRPPLRFSPSTRFNSGGLDTIRDEETSDDDDDEEDQPPVVRTATSKRRSEYWEAVEHLSGGMREWAPTADSEEFQLRRQHSIAARTDRTATEGTLRASITSTGARGSVCGRRTSIRTSTASQADFDVMAMAATAASGAHPPPAPKLESEATCLDSDDSDRGEDVVELPKTVIPKRRYGLSAEAHGGWNQRRATFQPTVEEKTPEQKARIIENLRQCPFFCRIEEGTLGRIADTMNIERFEADQVIVQQGDVGRSGYLLLEGTCDVYDDTVKLQAKPGDAPAKGTFVRRLAEHRFFGEMTMLWGLRRTMSVYASSTCTLAKLKRDGYMKLVTQEEIKSRTLREETLRKVEMFETLSDEAISQIADALEKKAFEPGEAIIRQGEPGKEFYVMLSGECKATVSTGTDSDKVDIQEYRRYHAGDVFGERALILRTTRAATITAVSHVEVLCLKRSRFERMLGPLESLQQKHYLHDPRKTIADFYRVGDLNGPLGSLRGPPDPEHQTSWFAVYRPTSRDAIAKLLSGKAVGKGLNVKGKSAKKNRMSGFVPFLQISKAEHKDLIEESVHGARLTVYYPTKAAFDLAVKTLQDLDGGPYELTALPAGPSSLVPVDRYEPESYGLNLAESLLRKAYIIDQNIAFLSGWETGRQSEPAFMDMNLHAVCGTSEPEVVLYQMDSENPMNPHALLIAYAEASVKPVVSDFDTFTVGSRGMQYEALPPEQQKLAAWCLKNTARILKTPSSSSWNSRWLEVLKEANEQGFCFDVPKYGFGDKTSYRLIEAVIQATHESGAVRHGAECFNFTFPQELDEDYLVVWEGFPDKPWAYMEEDELRPWLLERVEEGYSFPLNPVWPVRDEGWYEVYEALMANESTRAPLDSWYPAESHIKESIEALHKEYPDGFEKEFGEGAANKSRISVVEDLDSCERVDLALKHANLPAQGSKWRKVKAAATLMSRLRPMSKEPVG